MNPTNPSINLLISKYKKLLFLNNYLLRLNAYVFLLVSISCSSLYFSAANMAQPSNIIFVTLVIPLLNVFLMFYLSSIKSNLIKNKCTHSFLFKYYLMQQFLTLIVSLLSFPFLYWAFYTPSQSWILVAFTLSAFPNLIILIISSITDSVAYNIKKKLLKENFSDNY